MISRYWELLYCCGLGTVLPSLVPPLQLSKPLTLSVPCFSLPHCGGLERHKNGRHKGKGHWLRKIYWKQQWIKDTKSNSNNTNDRVYKEGNYSHRATAPTPRPHPKQTIPDRSLCHIYSTGKNLSPCKGPFPPTPGNDIRFYSLTSMSYLCPTPHYCKN